MAENDNRDFLNTNFASQPKGGGYQFKNLELGGYKPPSSAVAPSDFLSKELSSDFLSKDFGGGVDVMDRIAKMQTNTNDPPNGGFDWKSAMFGEGGEGGYLIPGLQTLGGLTQAYTGYKALGLAEDQFDFAKNQANRDFASQAEVYNTGLQDRQRARQAQAGGYDTSTDAGKAQFEKDLAAYVQANSIDPSAI